MKTEMVKSKHADRITKHFKRKYSDVKTSEAKNVTDLYSKVIIRSK